jgi:hypothetical protein
MNETTETLPQRSYDGEALSLFRILLGLLLLVNLYFNLVPYLIDFFSDMGIYTRAVNAETHRLADWRSVLQFCEEPWQLCLFIAVFTISLVCFIFGYQTKLANWVVFICFYSIYYRGLIFTSGGDMLLRLFILWCLFLPLNRFWSVDAALNRAPRDVPIPRALKAGVRAQILLLYFFGAVYKLIGAPWQNGTAPALAMHDGAQGTVLGSMLAENIPLLIPPINYGIIVFQLLFGLLVYSPYFNRITRPIALAGAFLMHVSFIFLLNIGVFPYICIAYLVLLFPNEWWETLLAKRRARLEKIRIYFEPGCDFCEKMALLFREFLLSPNTAVLPADANAKMLELLRAQNTWVVTDAATRTIYIKWEAVAFILRQNPFTWILGVITDKAFLKPRMVKLYEAIGNSRPRLAKITHTMLPFRNAPYKSSRFTQGICVMLIAIAFINNVVGIPGIEEKYSTRWLAYLGTFAMVSQKWNLFAPTPVRNRYTHRAWGVTVSGKQVDLEPLFTHGAIHREEKGRLSFENHQWLKYYTKLFDKRYAPVALLAVKRLCENYNRDPNHLTDPLKQASLELFRLNYKQAEENRPYKLIQHQVLECQRP